MTDIEADRCPEAARIGCDRSEDLPLHSTKSQPSMQARRGGLCSLAFLFDVVLGKFDLSPTVPKYEQAYVVF